MSRKTTEQKKSKSGAVELTEEDLNEVQGGVVGVVGEPIVEAPARTKTIADAEMPPPEGSALRRDIE